MLDVHAPEHPIHGIRDFFIHLLTITVGLLIALGLENVAEWRNHVHLRREADANIVSELLDNRRNVDVALSYVPDEKSNLARADDFLQSHGAGQPYDIQHMNFVLNLGKLRDASWQTATTTGTVGFMDYSHVKRYSAAYGLQTQFMQLQERALDSYLELQSTVAGRAHPISLSAAVADKAQLDVQQTIARLGAMQQIGLELQHAYKEALNER